MIALPNWILSKAAFTRGTSRSKWHRRRVVASIRWWHFTATKCGEFKFSSNAIFVLFSPIEWDKNKNKGNDSQSLEYSLFAHHSDYSQRSAARLATWCCQCHGQRRRPIQRGDDSCAQVLKISEKANDCFDVWRRRHSAERDTRIEFIFVFCGVFDNKVNF